VQLSGSVNSQIIGNPIAIIPIVGAVDPLWFINIVGTPVDTGPQCFPTVPSSYNGNRLFFPGLSRSYIAASYGETPTHREIQYATQDIPSVQLSIRSGINPNVLAQWQLALGQPADPRTFS
jgi:hypothetical protein